MENWDQINAVHRIQEYIEENINRKITLYKLAQIAGYSPWYTTRIFKQFTNHTPFEYIRKIRLSKAALELRDHEENSVLHVAFDYVFDSHEGFTRAFSKQFGMSPKKYRNHTPPVKLFIPHKIRDYYLTIYKGDQDMGEQVKKDTNTVFVQVIDKPARKLILKRAVHADHYFQYCSEVDEEVWGILASIKEALNEPMGMWLPDKLRPEGTSKYVQGVEVSLDYEGIVPDGFDIIELEPCKMMIFQGQPYKDECFGEAIEDLWRVMKNYDPTIYGFEYADSAGPRFQLMPMGYRGYIEGRPVRQTKTPF